MYCSVCGKEILDEAVVCTGCGCQVVKTPTNQTTSQSSQDASFSVNQNVVVSQKKVQVSLILGIVGIVTAWILALIGHAISIAGIVIGIKEYKKTEKITGLVLSIVGEVCAIISSIIGAVAMSSNFI